jgi:hypothetical protein
MRLKIFPALQARKSALEENISDSIKSVSALSEKKDTSIIPNKFFMMKSVLEIRTVFRADRGSWIPDLNPCKNTQIRIPDLRIRIRVKIRGSGSRFCGSRISNTGSEALFPGR